MHNLPNPFDKGLSDCYIERLIEFFDSDLGENMQLPLHESQKDLNDQEIQGKSFLASDEFILVDNASIPLDLRKSCERTGFVTGVVYQLIGRTSNTHVIIGGGLPLFYAEQLQRRIKFLIKRSQSKWILSSQHLTTATMTQLLEQAVISQESQQNYKAFPVQIYVIQDLFEPSRSSIGVKLFHRPWLDEHLLAVVGFNSSQLREKLLSIFEEHFVNILMLAGQANVRCLEFEHFGLVIEGLPIYKD